MGDYYNGNDDIDFQKLKYKEQFEKKYRNSRKQQYDTDDQPNYEPTYDQEYQNAYNSQYDTQNNTQYNTQYNQPLYDDTMQMGKNQPSYGLDYDENDQQSFDPRYDSQDDLEYDPKYSQKKSGKGGGMPTVSMILGVLSFFTCCLPVIPLVLGVIGFVVGIISIAKHKGNKKMAVTGIVLSIIAICLGVIALLGYVVILSDKQLDFMGGMKGMLYQIRNKLQHMLK
jgi:thiol:disulfide interchange protein